MSSIVISLSVFVSFHLSVSLSLSLSLSHLILSPSFSFKLFPCLHRNIAACLFVTVSVTYFISVSYSFNLSRSACLSLSVCSFVFISLYLCHPVFVLAFHFITLSPISLFLSFHFYPFSCCSPSLLFLLSFTQPQNPFLYLPLSPSVSLFSFKSFPLVLVCLPSFLLS